MRPNVLLVVFDDLGFADFGCYGSTISTPHVDSLAATGALFTNFTATPLCSPTRAALLTGRNQHNVGMGSIVQFAGTEPGYTGVIPSSAAMLPRLLRDQDYGTFAVGKWHLTPSHESGPAGPHHRWPVGKGFERFYGFLPGKVDHWRPEITIDNHVMGPPDTSDGYHLSEDLADRAIGFIADHLGGRPHDPFFAYLSFGAVHSPHHAPRDEIARYAGTFDHGWDLERDIRFQAQQDSGLFSREVALAPPNPNVVPWEQLPPTEKEVSARFMEAFAGFLSHADAQLGRVLNFLDRAGVRDNTIVVVLSDNGATDAGRDFGVLNEERILNAMTETPEDRQALAQEIGSGRTLNQYPNGWGQASNTPFRWFKHTVHNGGIRCPLVISWPGTVRSKLVHEHVHVTDLAPTLLDAAGVTPPTHVDGVAQIPIDGVSMLDALTSHNAHRRPGPQYFEVKGHRAVIDEGWKAVARHEPGTPYEEDVWELYDLSTDPAETADLANAHPERLATMVDSWWAEARANQVLPLDDRGLERLLDPLCLRPNNREWHFRPEMTPVPGEAAPNLAGRSFRIEARLRATSDDQGVVLAAGGQFSGFVLYLLDGEVVFHFNAAGTRAEVRSRIPPAEPIETVRVEFEVTGSRAEAKLEVDGLAPAHGEVDQILPFRLTVETMQCGRDLGTPVSPEYHLPFQFTGEIDVVRVSLDPTTPTRSTTS